MRRIAVGMCRVACASVRCYTPPEDLKKIYQSDLTAQKYPIDIVPSDSTLFAQFLFKAAEPKNGFDAILKDFATIETASTKLPVFWERNADVEKIQEFKSLSPATFFTLMWMQSNGMLEQLPAVREVFETYVAAARNKLIVKVYVGDEKDSSSISAAKKAAQDAYKGKAALDYKVIVDRDIVSGYAVDIGGNYINAAKGKEVSSATAAADVDYTNVPVPKFSKTIWEDNVETEVLRKYFDQLAQYDAEEAKLGV